MIYLTGDHHFGHENIIKYNNRPYKNAKDMDKNLVEIWNAHIAPEDVVYYLGDFTLSGRSDTERLFLQLNGIINVLGNKWHHDKRWLNEMFYLSASHYRVNIEMPIVVLEDVEQIEGRGVPAILCHYAFSVWERSHYGSIHFHGHSHGMLPKVPNRLDVGVDNAFKLTGEYRPLSLDECIKFARGD